MCSKSVHCSLCTDVEQSLLLVSESAFITTGRHSPFDIKQETIVITLIADDPHVGSGAR